MNSRVLRHFALLNEKKKHFFMISLYFQDKLNHIQPPLKLIKFSSINSLPIEIIFTRNTSFSFSSSSLILHTQKNNTISKERHKNTNESPPNFHRRPIQLASITRQLQENDKDDNPRCHILTTGTTRDAHTHARTNTLPLRGQKKKKTGRYE